MEKNFLPLFQLQGKVLKEEASIGAKVGMICCCLAAINLSKDISGHPVYDRDVEILSALMNCDPNERCFASDVPFKGQGANQALLDAVSLVKSLQRSQVGFGSTVIARTSEAVSDEARER